MAILAFQKPDKVIMLESTDKFGKFEFRPLEPGYRDYPESEAGSVQEKSGRCRG